MKFLFLILFTISSLTALADQYLIDEMESLKASLDKNDPDRVELSLRLADVYFDVSIQEGEGENIVEHRKKALKLYEDVLYGRDDLTAPPKKKSVVIKYQIARVLGKLGQIQKAKSYYHEVFGTEDVAKKIKREAAFSLAEFYEEEVKFNQADKFYMAAIDLCESVESCNYAHYKRAWLYYKELKLDVATSELKLALWDRNGVAREKIINDLLLFFSSTTTDGTQELAFIQDFAKKTNKPNLVRDLVESFYGAGNRVAGMNVLEAWNEKNSSLFYEARLLEENYGFRDWDKVRRYLSHIEKRSVKDLPTDKEEAQALKAMLKRVIVQIDSEAEVDSQYNNDLKRTIEVYLGFYPRDDMREKLQMGWLKAVSNEEEKLVKLGVWIKEDSAAGVDSKRITDLRKSRLSLAQELERPQIIIHEANEIANNTEGSDKRRFEYIKAFEEYKLKRYGLALPVFKKLATLSEDATPDEWAIKSQNLALDIYNIQKNYAMMIEQSNSWLNNAEVLSNPKLKSELDQMAKISTDANFERVVSLGETKEALESFTKFCFSGVYAEKSCPNAKVLAVKLSNQTILVRLLEKEKDFEALLVEYERMGRFADAAKLFEKLRLIKGAELPVYFKSAVLYELGGDFKGRDKILRKLISKVKKDKTIEEQYVAPLYLTLSEAGMINEKTLTLPWPTAKKLQIAEHLQSISNSKAASRLIASQKTYTGANWSKQVLNKIEALNTKQSKMSFYGRNSKKRFQRKVSALEKLAKTSKEYLEGADLVTRIYLLDIVKKAYMNFSVEILSTPLPEGLTDEVMMQVQANLTQMAAPYSQIAGEFEGLQNTQIKELTPEQNLEITAHLENPDIVYSELIKIPEVVEVANTSKFDLMKISTQKSELAASPNSLSALKGLETFYKENRSMRLASYFTGRINSLKESNE